MIHMPFMFAVLLAVLIAGTARPVQAQVPAADYLVVTFDLRAANGRIGGTSPTALNNASPPSIAAAVLDGAFQPDVVQPGLVLQLPGTLTTVACAPEAAVTVVQGINRRGDTVGYCFPSSGYPLKPGQLGVGQVP